MPIRSPIDGQTSSPVFTGRTVLRFAHSFGDGGGTETYLADLDRALLDRLPLTIIRVFLTHGDAVQRVETFPGKGRLIEIALPVVSGASSRSNQPRRSRTTAWLRDNVLYNPVAWRLFGHKWIIRRPLPVRVGEAVDAGTAVRDCFREFTIDLVVLHCLGSRDSDAVIREARNAGVPVCLVNHFSNARFRHIAVRRHVMMADAVAGITGVHVPVHLRGRFTTVSDGIDLEYYRRLNARPIADAGSDPVVLLPARVVREKGHLDLVRAAAALWRSDCRCKLAFAGRQDGRAFPDELHAAIDRFGISDHVRFLGSLTPADLRDWYAAARIVALPTYHDEGLGRVLIEAGAMGAPVVAYATDGVVDAVLPGRTGFLVPTGDVVELGTKLRFLLKNREACRIMGENGRRHVESRFGLQELASRHLQFYAAAMTREPLRSRVASAAAAKLSPCRHNLP